MNERNFDPVRPPMKPLESGEWEEGQVAPPYREPRMFAIGTAVDLMGQRRGQILGPSEKERVSRRLGVGSASPPVVQPVRG